MSSIKTGDASSKSSMQINTNGNNVTTQDNTSTAVSNTGGNTNSGSISTGDSTAVSEMNINNGQVEGKLEVEVNGEKKQLNIDKPGNYKLELNKKGIVVATPEVKTKQSNQKKETFLSRIIKFISNLFNSFGK